MALEHLRVLRQVELINIDGATVRDREKVTTMGELNLTAQLNLDILERYQILFKQVHHADTLIETDNKVETTGMESHTVGLLLENLIDFQIKASSVGVGPDFDCAVNTRCGDVGFLNAGVQTVDLTSMEWQHQVTVVNFISGTLHVDRQLNDLLVVG